MLGLVPLLAPAGLAVGTATLLLLLLITYPLFMRPLLDLLNVDDGGFFKRVALWPLRKAKSAVDRFVKGHVASLSFAFLGRARVAVRLLDNTEEVVRRLAGTLGDMSEQTWRALRTLRHVTIPNLIEQAVRPVRQLAQRLADRVGILEGRDLAAAVAIGGMLRQLPWGVGGDYIPNLTQWLNSYRHLWTQTFDFLAPKLEQVRTVWFPAVWERLTVLERGLTLLRENALPAIRLRLGALEDAIGDLPAQTQAQLERLIAPAVFAAAVVAAMRARAPNLFCRNVTDATEALCREDDGLIRDLLSGALVFAIALNPEQVARAGQELTGILGGVIDATVGR